jgi:hypothetical protein
VVTFGADVDCVEGREAVTMEEGPREAVPWVTAVTRFCQKADPVPPMLPKTSGVYPARVIVSV